MIVRKMTNKPKFDPNKNYQWEPTDEFVFTGAEFNLLYRVLQQEVSRATTLIQAFNVMQETFEKGVETGVIKEIVPAESEVLPKEADPPNEEPISNNEK